MKILKQDAREQIVRLRPESLDDVWHLSHVVDVGDVVTGTAHREPAEAREGGGARGGKVEKKAMTLGVAVEQVEFHESTDRLRIMGPIIEGPQDIGMYHTLNVEPFNDITVRKTGRGWRDHHLARLKEAVDATKRPRVVILAIEENEAVVALLHQFGVRKAADIVGHASGKQYAPTKGAEEEFFDEVLMALRDYRPDGAPLIVIGPGFAKERFLKHAQSRQRTEVAGGVIEPTGQAGMTGVHEALRRGVIERVQQGERVSMETALVGTVMERIATAGLVAYGDAETRRALDLGAVETLLVTDKRLRDGGDVLLETAQATGAEVHVVSTRHEAGVHLLNLGGVAALLRYRPT